MLCIFDLDGTLLDSSHRQLTRADGSLDLAHWIENSSPEKVLLDKPLPLIAEYKSLLRRGHRMIVCTARVMAVADYQLLRKYGIFYDHILSRPIGCKLADHTLKEIQLRELAQRLGLSWAHFSSVAVIYEDNRNVLNTMHEAGIKGVFAPDWNNRAAA